MLLQEGAQPLVDDGLHLPAMSVLQLALGLALELRLRQLDQITATSPSRTSSPHRFSFTSLKRPVDWPTSLMVRVSAVRKPDRCVPPSTVLMLLAKLKTVSE